MPVFPPTSTSSSMMTGSAPTGSITPPIWAPALKCTRDADLRARPHKGMGIDERALTDICPDVDVHRRHADDPAREVRAIAHRGSARHDPYPVGGREAFQRQRVLVDERPAAMVHRHVRQRTPTEPEEDSLLHPRIDPPAGGGSPSPAPRRAPARGQFGASCSKTARASSGSAPSPAAKRAVTWSDRGAISGSCPQLSVALGSFA